MKAYIGVGHGTKHNGVEDPGAVAADGTTEQSEAHTVADACSAALTRCGFDHYVERGSGPGHDPNFTGSIKAVNDGKYDVAIEIHFDWRGAPKGGFGLFYSNRSKLLTNAVGTRWGQAGLPQRPDDYRSDLSFIKKTNCPAIIWECDRIAKYDESINVCMGEAIAAGLCDWAGIKWVPVPSPTPHKPTVDVRGAFVVKGGSPEHRFIEQYPQMAGDRRLAVVAGDETLLGDSDTLGFGMPIDGARYYFASDRYDTLRMFMRGEGLV